MQEHLKQELGLGKKPPTCRKSRTIWQIETKSNAI